MFEKSIGESQIYKPIKYQTMISIGSIVAVVISGNFAIGIAIWLIN